VQLVALQLVVVARKAGWPGTVLVVSRQECGLPVRLAIKVQRSSILSEQICRSVVDFKVQGCPSHRVSELLLMFLLIAQRARERLYVCVMREGAVLTTKIRSVDS